jgi:nucleotide-binding universal stress UspA family protein
MFDSILISLDGSQESEAVLPVMERILSNGHTKVTLVRVAPEVNNTNVTFETPTKLPADMHGVATDQDMLYAAKESEIAAYLKTIAARLEQAGAESVTTEYSFNNPVTEILRCVKRHNIDLIAMATHGRAGLNRLVHGSVTESVLHQAPCPMLIVRTGDDEMNARITQN